MTAISSTSKADGSWAPRVSVIVTVYKRTEFLQEALKSVFGQCFEDYEVIVADDSGIAASKQIVLGYAAPQLTYLANAKTLGIAASVVGAVQRARGEYIAILNDDDVWEKEFLAELVPPLDTDPERVLAFCDHWMMDSKGVIDDLLSNTWSESFARASLPGGVVLPGADFTVAKHGVPIACGSVFRKDAVDWALVVDEVRGAYDFWIACLLARARRPLFYVPKRLTRYRIHGAMETRRRSHDKEENLVYMFSKMVDEEWFPELKGNLRVQLGDALFRAGRDKLHFNRSKDARRYFWRSFLVTLRLRALGLAAVSLLPNFARTAVRLLLGVWRTFSQPHVGTDSGPFRITGHNG